MKRNLLIIAIALLCLKQANADFEGTVTEIRDGGSVVVNSKGQDIMVKLNSIVTPYPNQGMYSQSRIVAENIFLGREVNVITNNRPNNGCVQGELLSNGINLNEAILLTGYAWLIDKTVAPDSYRLIETQNETLKRGLFNPDFHFHFDSNSLPPSYVYKECLATASKVPIADQYSFVAEQEKYGFGYSVRAIAIGVFLGFILLISVIYIDKLGVDLSLSKYFKLNKKDEKDVFK